MATKSNVHFTIGGKLYKTISKAQQDFNLKSSKPIYQALIDGMFRNKECKIVQNTTHYKRYISVGSCERIGATIKCNETGKQYISIANLYRTLYASHEIRVPYATLHRALLLHDNIRINGLTYTVVKPSAKLAKSPHQYKVGRSTPTETKIVKPKEVKVISQSNTAKDNLVRMVKEKLTAQIKADQFTDAKETMQMLEWLNNQ